MIAVSLTDSSGWAFVGSRYLYMDLEIVVPDTITLDISGDVLVRRDSSGDIDGRDIEGSVKVERDSSGDLRFRAVGADFVVEKDSSGDIVADGIGGDFRVLMDGSGGIHSSDVIGAVDLPSD